MVKLNVDFLLTAKRYLLREKQEIEKRLETVKNEDPFFQADKTAARETGEEALGVAGHERSLILQKEMERSLSLIKRALSRIGVGKYGICENCKKPISPERLKIYPIANMCLDCEQKREAGKKLGGK